MGNGTPLQDFPGDREDSSERNKQVETQRKLEDSSERNKQVSTQRKFDMEKEPTGSRISNAMKEEMERSEERGDNRKMI